MEDMDKYIDMLRLQRHDLMNDIQVIYGFLQVGKVSSAEKYIKNICFENDIISKIYSLGDNKFAYSLENGLKRFFRKDIKLDINIEIDYLSEKLFYSDFNKKSNLVNTIFIELEKMESESIYIYIYEDRMGTNLAILNDENILDELDFDDSWSEMQYDISNVKVLKCMYDNYLAYRLIFK